MRPTGLLLLVALLFAGCATPTARNLVTPTDVQGLGTPSNVAMMNEKGELVGSFQDGLPTNIMQDDQGAWVTTPGQGGAVVLNMGGANAYIWSPQDGAIDELTIKAPDGSLLLEVKGMTFNVSSHAVITAQMFVAGVQGTQGMTQIEATRRIKEMEAGGELLSNVAEGLIRAYVPTLPIE